MEFGVFDHLDRSDLPLRDYYASRLALIAQYDRAGFHAYHVAEHHATPLGMAPSPSVFLAAAAQHTRRLRLGTLVYALPLHHPLRMIEEICMLDQMSGGRLELGFGRGSSPIELEYYGQDPATAQQAYESALDLVLRGLAAPSIDFAGREVPLVLEPLQRPHPPVWYGVHSRESAERAAKRGFNIVCNEPAAASRLYIERFREAWRAAQPAGASLPRMGVTQFVVVGESDDNALAVARRAYSVWHASFHYLFRRLGRTPRISGGEPDFDALHRSGKGVAGTPDRVRDFLARRLDAAGATYCINRFAFGDLSLDEAQRSVALFVSEVMPRLATQAPIAAA
ncbi:MAG TPA: LLM class flavin-dependent oxidoreductase [Stellaceae bacterium]|nr:LLM class flavin-dependent oxidoreductase [Stellaceae bacterium]